MRRHEPSASPIAGRRFGSFGLTSRARISDKRIGSCFSKPLDGRTSEEGDRWWT